MVRNDDGRRRRASHRRQQHERSGAGRRVVGDHDGDVPPGDVLRQLGLLVVVHACNGHARRRRHFSAGEGGDALYSDVNDVGLAANELVGKGDLDVCQLAEGGLVRRLLPVGCGRPQTQAGQDDEPDDEPTRTSEEHRRAESTTFPSNRGSDR